METAAPHSSFWISPQLFLGFFRTLYLADNPQVGSTATPLIPLIYTPTHSVSSETDGLFANSSLIPSGQAHSPNGRRKVMAHKSQSALSQARGLFMQCFVEAAKVAFPTVFLA